MSKKVFVWAAEFVLYDCAANGYTNKYQSQAYRAYTPLFVKFAKTFSMEKWDAYIDKKLKKLNEAE